MPLKDILLQELETADEAMITDIIAWIRFQKSQPSETLQAVRTIQDESSRALVLGELASINTYYFSAALEAVQTFQDETVRLSLLHQLARLHPSTAVESEPEIPLHLDLTTDPLWIESTKQKIDAAIRSLESNGGQDGEIVIAGLLSKFQLARETRAKMEPTLKFCASSMGEEIW
jgi:hypothetical protein